MPQSGSLYPMGGLPEGSPGAGAPGQYIKAREYPNASFRDATAPNADTLYTIAWVDLGSNHTY